MKVVQDLGILIFEMFSERFDPAAPPSREISARYANPSNLKQSCLVMTSDNHSWFPQHSQNLSVFNFKINVER